jgi:DNA-binding transcriptional regulator YhcF (GntR family)
MIYHNEKALFIKIAERICDDILSGCYSEGALVPSVRELAAEYEVNINTALRAFELLQRDNILLQQRGIGMSVAKGAKKRILSARRKEFLQHELPDFLRRMELLGLSLDDIAREWNAQNDVSMVS